nr:hypothetical protein [Tanacetum cinerariifolium]
ELEAELNQNIDWDEVIDHVNKKAKEDKAVKRYQALKRKPQTEAQASKNMMIYLKNVVGFKMDYFKGMSYDDIRPIFEQKLFSNVAFLMITKEKIDEEDSRALKRLNESQEEKAAKKQKLDEEVEELKRHLQIVPNEEDDDCTITITPILSTEEPNNSLSIGDDHLDTIQVTESDEVIKSSVENIVPIPSESEGIPDNMYSTSIDDDSFSIDDIEYVEASPPDSELISLEVVEIIISKVGGIDEDILLTIKDDILHEKLLNINLLIAKIKALKDNPTLSFDFMTKSSSTSLNFLLEETNTFDNSLPESETFYFYSEENSSGNTTTRADISLPDYEAFYKDHVKEISSGNSTTHSNFSLYDSFIFDLLINPFPPADKSDFYHEEFVDELAHIISPPKYDCFSFKNKPNAGDFTMDVVEDTFPTRKPRVHVPNVLPTHPTRVWIVQVSKSIPSETIVSMESLGVDHPGSALAVESAEASHLDANLDSLMSPNSLVNFEGSTFSSVGKQLVKLCEAKSLDSSGFKEVIGILVSWLISGYEGLAFSKATSSDFAFCCSSIPSETIPVLDFDAFVWDSDVCFEECFLLSPLLAPGFLPWGTFLACEEVLELESPQAHLYYRWPTCGQ